MITAGEVLAWVFEVFVLVRFFFGEGFFLGGGVG